MILRALMALLALGLACARAPTRAADSPEEGQASYYADRFEGRRTASGERYDGRLFTCAHRTHPFGAVLAVTDVATGRSVRVRVNDRGPWTKGRIVDLSRAAALSLGIVERGLAHVRVVRVR